MSNQLEKIKELIERRATARMGGGDKAIAKQHDKGKYTARERIAMLLDEGLIYSDILEKTGASSATISRVRRSMLDNGAGGVVQSIIIREGLDKPEPPEE